MKEISRGQILFHSTVMAKDTEKKNIQAFQISKCCKVNTEPNVTKASPLLLLHICMDW